MLRPPKDVTREVFKTSSISAFNEQSASYLSIVDYVILFNFNYFHAEIYIKATSAQQFLIFLLTFFIAAEKNKGTLSF